MSRNTSIAPGEFYHLYNRGTEKRDIFNTDSDRNRFVSLLYLCNSTEPVHFGNSTRYRGSTSVIISTQDRHDTLVDIGAYCLMPNHVHLLVREKGDGNISKFMQKLMTGYTMYFNKRYERTGTLFQGKFKATHANEDRYLKYLISYIHLNPIKLIDPEWKENGIRDRKAARTFLGSYRYSSYLDYLGQPRPESSVINRELFPDYFPSAKYFVEEVGEWLDYRG